MSDDLVRRLRSAAAHFAERAWNAGYNEACWDSGRMAPGQLDVSNKTYDEAELRLDQVINELASRLGGGT